MAVEVGELLHVFDNGFRLYHCRFDGDFPYRQGIAGPPAWVYREVSSVQLVDPRSTAPLDWRFVGNRPVLIGLMQGE